MDQLPRNVVAAMLSGEPSSIPVPDVDETGLLVVVGGSPLVTNGSLEAAPDYRGMMKALRRRDGRLVVVDPVRTATASAADEPLQVRPGTDLFLLVGVRHTPVDEDMVRLRRATGMIAGVDEVRAAVRRYPPSRVAPVCQVPTDTIRRLARDVATTERAAGSWAPP